MAALKWIFTFVFIVTITPIPAFSQSAMSYIYYHDQDTDVDKRNEYLWRILKCALDHTQRDWGDYVLTPSNVLYQKRRIYILEHNQDSVNVGLFPSQRLLEKRLIPVRIPVDRGMLGYRVLLIRSSEQALFDRVQSLEDLKRFRFGLLSSWEDVPIMEAADQQVVTGSSYPGLFQMLSSGRFDAFSRSSGEILGEFADHQKDLQGVAIEKHILLHYPMPAYFWFPNSEDGRRRAERVRQGLLAMIRDGSYQALFDEQFGEMIKRLDLDHRLVLELPNPLLGDEDPLDNPVLWYRPRSVIALNRRE